MRAAGARDHQRRTAVRLPREQRLYRAQARIDIVSRSREAWDAEALHGLNTTLLANGALRYTTRVSDSRDTHTHEFVRPQDRLQALVDVLLQANIFGPHLLMDQEPSEVIHLPDQAPRVTAEVLPNQKRISGDHDRVRHDVEVGFESVLEHCRAARVIAILGAHVSLDPVAVASELFDETFVIAPALRKTH